MALLHLDGSRVVCILPFLRLEFNNIPGRKVSENAAISNGLGDFVKAALEFTHSTCLNVIHRSIASVLVIDSSCLVQDMAVTNPVNLVAGVTVLGFVLMEPECESALEVLHFFGSEGNTENSSEEATDIAGWIAVVDKNDGTRWEDL